MALLNFSQFRSKFIEFSGRNDLSANETGGFPYVKKADYYIWQAIQWLDSKYSFMQERRRYQKDLAAGSWEFLIPRAIKIDSIWITGADRKHKRLCRMDSIEDARAYFGKEFGQVANATPQFYVEGVHLMGVGQQGLKTTNYTGSFTYDADEPLFDDESTPASVGKYNTMQIHILPPPDQLYTVTAIGKFYSLLPFASTDTNVWIEAYPQALMFATMLQLEAMYRSSEGMRDWAAAVELEMAGVTMVDAQRKSEHITELRG